MEVVHGVLGFSFLAVFQSVVIGFLFFLGAPASVFGETAFAISEPRGQSALATILLVLLASLTLPLGIRKRLVGYGLVSVVYAVALCWLTGSFRLELASAFAGLGLGLIVLSIVNLYWQRLLWGPRQGLR